jgi:chromatin remodeling complex protein RSC6
MSAPSVSKATKAPRKAATAAVPAPVAAPAPSPAPVAAPAPAPVAAAPVQAAEDNINITVEFNSLVEKVNALRTTLQAVFSDMKKLEKRIPRELKKAQKGRRRRAAPVEGEEAKPKKETVFTKPTAVSDELCKFLGVPVGTLLSRSDVTTRVCQYAKTNNLMVKQVIKADAPMRKLLKLTEKDELKILNLQRYLKPHYPKAAVPAVTA